MKNKTFKKGHYKEIIFKLPNSYKLIWIISIHIDFKNTLSLKINKIFYYFNFYG